MGIRLRRFVAPLVVATTCFACTGSKVDGGRQPVVAGCAAGEAIEVQDVREVRTVTDLVFLEVNIDGNRTERRARDYPLEIVPSMTIGDAIPLQSVAEAVAEAVGDARSENGPPPVNSSALDEDLTSGTYLMYAGATRLDATFEVTCSAPDGATIDGSFQSWGAPVVGILGCSGPRPPDGTFGALVVMECPAVR